ncbi:hypothetical protein ZWY2020_011664 [Hordeum vulgare]|nr:hypothetical protein ZWY2020_011664 [Hordeum vulgare]
MRVRIALRELGVAFDYVEEDLRMGERSDLVRRMNPVHRSVPILIHRGRPVCGSLNILEYIDEVWSAPGETRRLLPGVPAGRADARFWADFIDHKVFATQTRFLKSKGEEKHVAKEELVEQLKRLEEVLGDKEHFLHGGFDLEVECPKLMRWVKRCKERESVRAVLPDETKMYELHKEWYGIE